MDAVIYTVNDEEYEVLSGILEEESFAVSRDPLDHHGHYEHRYDLVVIALEGGRGMQTMLNWAERYPDIQIIWITSDPYFAGLAIRWHIHDFIERPYEPDRIRASVRSAREKCRTPGTWHFGPGRA